MSDPKTVLVLCTGNSARSILGEALLRRAGFDAHSAGSRPTGTPNPLAIERLEEEGIDAAFARSKSWDEFAEGADGAPDLDVVLTVCDSAAGETCPLWHGAPVRSHWGLADPAAVEGSREQRRAAFKATFDKLADGVERFAALPLAELSDGALKRELDAIGDDIDAAKA